jgi:hypothetical protein
MGKLIEESMKSGALLATGGLAPMAKCGARIRRAADEITVIDGPFVEAKELSGGFAIMQAESKEDVIDMVKNFMKIAGDGDCDVHQIMDQPGE